MGLSVMLRRGAPLSPAWTGALAALAVATLANVGACLSLPHANGAVTFVWMGVEAGLVSSLVRDGDLAGAPAKLQPVLALARKLMAAPDSVTRADAEAVFAAGWDDTALYHAVAVTALFNFMNRLVEGLGIELDASYVGPASQRLADRGYLPLLELMKSGRPP